MSRLALARSGSMPETTVHPGESSHGALGILVVSARAGSPMNTQTKPSCSSTG